MSPSPTQEGALTFRASVVLQWLSQPTASSCKSEVVQGSAKRQMRRILGNAEVRPRGCLMMRLKQKPCLNLSVQSPFSRSLPAACEWPHFSFALTFYSELDFSVFV